MKVKGQIKFINKSKSLFYATVKKRVDHYFEEHQLSKFANGAVILKTVILLLGYLLPFIAVLIWHPTLWVDILLWVMMGIGLSGIGMSIMHDANHGAYSSNKTVNYILGHTLNLLGGSVFNWKLQHNILHHTYTNIVDMDEDIEDRVVFRFSPHSKVKRIHRFQWLYAIFFYGIITVYWALLKDFIQYYRYLHNEVNPNTPRQNRIVLLRIIISKTGYLFVFLVMPILVFGNPYPNILIGFLAMHFTAGIILTVVFQLAHTVEGTDYPLPDVQGHIETDWAIHQMRTTVNFSRNNKVISWYVGGLNYQIEHHLFPRICHIHYPKISAIVRETAREFNIPYLENRTFLHAFRSHLSALRRFGKLPSINEAIV